MTFQVGNKLWNARSSHGRNPIFDDKEKLWDACVQYFEWVESNPLIEEKIFHASGLITKDTVEKIRAMTISGLCFFIGVSFDTWLRYKASADFCDIVKEAESVIFNQKFAGAAADLLNASIICRELGLADKTENKHDVKVDTAKDLTDDELKAELAKLGITE
jgi:hypothetical protein